MVLLLLALLLAATPLWCPHCAETVKHAQGLLTKTGQHFKQHVAERNEGTQSYLTVELRPW